MNYGYSIFEVNHPYEHAIDRDKRLLTNGYHLTYDNQLKFKKWVKRKLHIKGDPFYFDSVYGVDSKTAKNIPGLFANGTITIKDAYEIIKSKYAI